MQLSAMLFQGDTTALHSNLAALEGQMTWRVAELPMNYGVLFATFSTLLLGLAILVFPFLWADLEMD
jgi:hypothetical protein